MTESFVNSDPLPNIQIFRSHESMAVKLYGQISQAVNKASAAHKDFNIALSGGSTPIKLFDIIARNFYETINWKNIHIYWGDERCVPPDDPQSNYGNAYNSILRYTEIPEDNIHRIKGENAPEMEKLRYQELVRQNLDQVNSLPCFDMIMLGVGDDGHTASIFPDQMYMLDYPGICGIAVQPVTGQKRITLTGNVINNARYILFLVTGKPKAKILKTIIKRSRGWEKYPAAYINSKEGTLAWFLDTEAAKYLNW